jgi:hypothetical protein
MILRTKPRIRDRLPRLRFLRSVRSGLLLSVLCAAASAAPPPDPPASTPAATPAATPATPPGESTVAPDEGFLEFLGADDVGDAAWWEFLKKAPPRGSVAPAPSPQDAKQ